MNKILVIEDEIEMARGLKDILEFDGYEVITAATGREGIQAASRKEPDCVILDLMLPDISGYEVCEQIRLKHKVPILMLTAKSNPQDNNRTGKDSIHPQEEAEISQGLPADDFSREMIS